MNLFNNPFADPIFVESALRLLLLFAVGGIVIVPVAHKVPSLKNELWSRYRSWAVIAPLFLMSVFGGAIPSALLFLVVISRAVKEFSTIASLPRSFARSLVLLIPLSLGVVVVSRSVTLLPPLYFMVLGAVAIKSNRTDSFGALTVSLLGAFWLIYLMLHAALLKQLVFGSSLLVFAGTAVALADIGSYTLGKIFARLGLGNSFRVASNISGQKTVPGYAGAMIGVSLALVLFRTLLSDVPSLFLWAAPLVIPGAAALGDLFESLFKRFYVVKDSGSSIPGHGGVLDRLDSFIPTVTVLFYLVQLF